MALLARPAGTGPYPQLIGHECGPGQEHNERQEFLGDAVLELCVSWELYRRFPSAREGELTKMRSSLVSAVSLAERARDMGLDRLLKLVAGQGKSGGKKAGRGGELHAEAVFSRHCRKTVANAAPQRPVTCV